MQIRFWTGLKLHQKFYIAGVFLVFINYFLYYREIVENSDEYLPVFGAPFSIGFTCYIFRCRKVYKRSIKRCKLLIFCKDLLATFLISPSQLLTIFKALLAVSLIAPARWLVANATALPAQDFDVTTSAVVITLYPIVYIIFLNIGLGVALIGIIIWGSILVFYEMVKGYLHMFLRSFGIHVKLVIRPSFLELPSNIAHVIGLVLMFYYLAHISGGGIRTIMDNDRLIRAAAFHLEYFEAKEYIGIPSGLNVKLHANGIVSYSTKVGLFDAKICVFEISNYQTCQNVLSEGELPSAQ